MTGAAAPRATSARRTPTTPGQPPTRPPTFTCGSSFATTAGALDGAPMSSMSPPDRQLRLPLRDATRTAGGSVDELETPHIVVAASDASIGPVLEKSLREAGYHVIL